MSDVRARFEQAVSNFRVWADAYLTIERDSYWECHYEYWDEVGSAFPAFLDSSDPQHWDRHVIEQLFYILARDNEMEMLKEDLIARPAHLLVLAKAGLRSTEQDARWQLADGLGSVETDEDEVVLLLEAYAADANDYVSRRALLALGRRRSPVAKTLARHARDTGDEYQRMAALEVFHLLGSPMLPTYLGLAQQDGREYLVAFAQQIRSGRHDTPS